MKVEPDSFGVHFNGRMTTIEDKVGNPQCRGEVPGWMDLVNSTSCTVTWQKRGNGTVVVSDGKGNGNGNGKGKGNGNRNGDGSENIITRIVWTRIDCP